MPPVLKNTHRVHNLARRHAWAKALHKQYEKKENAAYVDPAQYEGRDAMAFVVVDRQKNYIGSGSIFTEEPEVAEETAIALAMTASANIKHVISDFKSAIINFFRGRISPKASAILISGFRHDAQTGEIYLIWAPAHSSLSGNESTHDAAQGFTDESDIDPNTSFAHLLRWSCGDRLVSLTKPYRLE